MDKNETTMNLLEDGDLKYWWECAKCWEWFKASKRFEKSKVCPSCKMPIGAWVGLEDEE